MQGSQTHLRRVAALGLPVRLQLLLPLAHRIQLAFDAVDEQRQLLGLQFQIRVEFKSARMRRRLMPLVGSASSLARVGENKQQLVF